MHRPHRLAIVLAALLAGCAAAPSASGPALTPTAATPAPPVTASVAPSTATTAPLGPTAPQASATNVSPTSGEHAAVTGQPADAQAASQLMPHFMAYNAAINQVLQAGGQGAPTQQMRETMAGQTLDRWTNQAADYRSKGWKQQGTLAVELVQPSGVELAAGTATIDFCVSSAGVTITDASGKPIAAANPALRAQGGTATLAYSGGRWRVTDLTGLQVIANCP